MELYLHSQIRLHGVVLGLKKNSTGTALLLPLLSHCVVIVINYAKLVFSAYF